MTELKFLVVKFDFNKGFPFDTFRWISSVIGRIHVPWSVTNGMAYFHERAPYVVSDEIHEGDSGVPTTVIVTVRHEGWAGGEKRGSLQGFVPESTDMSDMGSANIPAEEVGYRLFDGVSIANVLALQLPSQLVCKGSLSAMSCGNLYLF